jgi:putative endopeptidase
VTKIFTLAGDTPEQAAREAAAVLEIETALAKASTSRTDLRQPENHYHIYTLADFEKLAPAGQSHLKTRVNQHRDFCEAIQ